MGHAAGHGHRGVGHHAHRGYGGSRGVGGRAKPSSYSSSAARRARAKKRTYSPYTGSYVPYSSSSSSSRNRPVGSTHRYNGYYGGRIVWSTGARPRTYYHYRTHHHHHHHSSSRSVSAPAEEPVDPVMDQLWNGEVVTLADGRQQAMVPHGMLDPEQCSSGYRWFYASDTSAAMTHLMQVLTADEIEAVFDALNDSALPYPGSCFGNPQQILQVQHDEDTELTQVCQELTTQFAAKGLVFERQTKLNLGGVVVTMPAPGTMPQQIIMTEGAPPPSGFVPNQGAYYAASGYPPPGPQYPDPYAAVPQYPTQAQYQPQQPPLPAFPPQQQQSFHDPYAQPVHYDVHYDEPPPGMAPQLHNDHHDDAPPPGPAPQLNNNSPVPPPRGNPTPPPRKALPNPEEHQNDDVEVQEFGDE